MTEDTLTTASDHISDEHDDSKMHDVEWGVAPAAEASPEAGKNDRGYGASWTMQYITLFRRAIKVRRFEALSIQDLTQIVVVGVLAGGYHDLCFTSRALFLAESHLLSRFLGRPQCPLTDIDHIFLQNWI